MGNSMQRMQISLVLVLHKEIVSMWANSVSEVKFTESENFLCGLGKRVPREERLKQMKWCLRSI